MATFTTAQMVEAYIKGRDRKKQADDEHKLKMKPLTEFMEKLEGLLLANLQETGADSVNCPAGTVYIRTETSATIEDKSAFTDWVKTQPDWSALDLKANKTAIKAMIEAKETLPPGLRVTQVKLIGVQRS
jgi:hypothetical protein